MNEENVAHAAPAPDAFDYGGDTSNSGPTNAALAKISDLVREAKRAEKELAQADELAKTKRQQLDAILMTMLPEAMDQAGLGEFTTTAGFHVKIKKDITHSLAEDRREAGMNWLESHGHGSIIKRELQMSFIKGQEEQAKTVAKYIVDTFNLPVSEKRNVHASTLKSLLKDLLEKGKEVDEAIFKIQRIRKAEIK